MSEVSVRPDGAIEVRDGDDVLAYTPRLVTAVDGSTVAHESCGGQMASVWATSVGDAFVEISHLGHGPEGGELVMVVTRPGHSPVVALGDLVTAEVPAVVTESWPAAVDLAIGLIADETIDSGTRADVEAFHQRLLEVLFDG